MVYIFLVLVILIIITKLIYTEYSAKQLLELTKDEELDNITKGLPNNKEICKQILEQIDNKDVKIDFSVDEKSTTSFYNVFSNTILLANSEIANKSFARLMFISHECWHSKQNKKFLWSNFILANINMIYLFATIVLSILNVISQNIFYILFGIYLILNLFGFFARNIIETEATYMAYIVSKEYLEKNYEDTIVKKITQRYKDILSKGTTNFLFGLFTNNLIQIIIYMLIGLVKGWW
ncbi:MAG: hypothetical protein E7311_00930 [Clostridiales bacterium]|nr:hypothetical protein [Clostridiales bacterium]